jgi:hypothetical protein
MPCADIKSVSDDLAVFVSDEWRYAKSAPLP